MPRHHRPDHGWLTTSQTDITNSTSVAGLGGVLAIALPASSWFGALYIGASTPMVVTSMAKGTLNTFVPQVRSRRATEYGPVESFVRAG
jgi:hypothetical protein